MATPFVRWLKPRRGTQLQLEPLEERTVPSLLVPQSGGRRDMVYDDAKSILYITTGAGGLITRYNAATDSALTAFTSPLAAQLNGADLTPDGKFLYVAEDSISKVLKVNTTDGSTSEIAASAGAGSNGAFDVSISSTGVGLITSRRLGAAAGGVDLLQIDTSKDTITARNDVPPVYQDSQLFRADNRSTISVMEASPNNSIFSPSR